MVASNVDGDIAEQAAVGQRNRKRAMVNGVTTKPSSSVTRGGREEPRGGAEGGALFLLDGHTTSNSSNTTIVARATREPPVPENAMVCRRPTVAIAPRGSEDKE